MLLFQKNISSLISIIYIVKYSNNKSVKNLQNNVIIKVQNENALKLKHHFVDP